MYSAMRFERILSAFLLSVVLQAQESEIPQSLRTPDQPKKDGVAVESGTKIPLTLLNTLSSKQTAEGDRVYLETLYPVLVNGTVVIPPGSYVSGTVTQIKRPGRAK